MIKKLAVTILIVTISMGAYNNIKSQAYDSDIVRGVLDVTVEEADKGMLISNARVIVVDTNGKIVGNELTDDKGEVSISVTTPLNKRFPMNMGEVAVIVIAEGYNEKIDFNVTINEFGENKGRANIYLEKIRKQGRNEPQYIHGSYHRLTVFQMLDYYAMQIGLQRQKLPQEIGEPWSPRVKKN